MIELPLSIIGIVLVTTYLLSYGDFAMVINLHNVRLAIFHEKRILHLYPGILVGFISIGYSLFYENVFITTQYIFLGILGFVVFNELMGFPGIFKPIFYPEFIKYDKNVPKKITHYLEKDDLIAITGKDTMRVYPVLPLKMNHVVNDEFNEEKIGITHCALCKTSVVFSREINGREIELMPTTSTNESNLIIQDSEGNFWQQMTGAGLGPKNKGETLQIIDSKIIQVDKLDELSFEGYGIEIMNYTHRGRKKAAETPFNALMRFVDNPNHRVLFPVSHWDYRLHKKENVMAFHLDDKPYAIVKPKREQENVSIALGGKEIEVTFSNKDGIHCVRDKNSLEEIQALYPVYWFAWVTRYQDTQIIDLEKENTINFSKPDKLSIEI